MQQEAKDGVERSLIKKASIPLEDVTVWRRFVLLVIVGFYDVQFLPSGPLLMEANYGKQVHLCVFIDVVILKFKTAFWNHPKDPARFRFWANVLQLLNTPSVVSTN